MTHPQCIDNPLGIFYEYNMLNWWVFFFIVLLIVYCQSQMKTGKFVCGLSNFRIDAIQAHEVAEWPKVKKI